MAATSPHSPIGRALLLAGLALPLFTPTGVSASTPARPATPADLTRLEIAPFSATLDGQGTLQHLIVTACGKDGETYDVTDRATVTAANARVAKVHDGTVEPVADGKTRIVARLGHLESLSMEVTVRNATAPPGVEFVNDVMPLLAKTGCNSTACHGSPAGKGGLKLSLFGYEPDRDYAALATEAGGQRLDRQDAAHSLLLQKATAAVSHGGGQRLTPASPEYRTLLAWIRAGAPGIGEFEARVRQIRVLPAAPWLPAPGARQRLVVLAELSDGAVQDVTAKALFSSSEDAIAAVDAQGRVEAKRPGETAVMVRYLGQVAVSRVAVLPPWKLPAGSGGAQHNFLDGLVQSKLRRLREVPSAPCTDEEFLRRATLDVCGIIPTVEEVRRFAADRSPDRRAKLIDALLARPEFVDLWTMKWNDTLRNSPRLTRNGLGPYSDWIREQIRGNRPYDQFVRDLLTASGNTVPAEVASAAAGDDAAPAMDATPAPPQQLQRLRQRLQARTQGNAAVVRRIERRLAMLADASTAAAPGKKRRGAIPAPAAFNPAANYFVVSKDPLDVTSATSQIFLGVRIECARCHNHPFERWTQNDFYGLAAFFNGVSAKGRKKVAQVVRVNPNAPPLRHPKTNEIVEPRTLDGAEVAPAGAGDRRAALAAWITSPQNPYFARALVNRVWGYYFGRGIVDPIDDMRATNPPSNPELLDALATDFASHGFDVQRLHRLILTSATYAQSSRPNRYNAHDTANFARYYPRRLMAEQLYDSLSQATGVFLEGAGRRALKGGAGRYGVPIARDTTRIMQVPTRVIAGRRVDDVSLFLDTFGKPRRAVVCECERSADGNINQALALLNGDEVNAKITAGSGRVRQLLRSGKPESEMIEELYLAALARRPAASEQEEAASLIRSGKTHGEGVEDLMWCLLNSREFLFIH